MVWPVSPAADGGPAEAALSDAGVDIAPFEPIAVDLRKAHADAVDADRAALAAVQKALDDARTAYLELRWDDMVSAVDLRPHLALLSRPEHKELLWQMTFQRGLGLLSRKDPVAAEYLRLALTIDPARRPDKALYGPDVVSAFADVVAATVVARPVTISVDPPSARVVVDGVPRIDSTRSVSLPPGLHVVRASAPGYETHAALLDTRERATTTVTLPVARDRRTSVGVAWMRGLLSGAAAHERRAMLALAGASRIVLVDGTRARIIDARGAGEWVTGSSSADAVARAVAPPAAPVSTPPRVPASTPIYKRWWFWAATVGVVTSAAAAGYAVSSGGDDRWRVFASDP